ncbi:hypothetical protein SAMN04488029_0679 [Reichenbachiella faecimaris]|uniref:Uncharacterized protein n=1 Tax=Reichenbachiella faecimaris TaxID=692418 RepID=A0A1W2G746_REIFA|nr:hypothetical protein [Reichenbachiella faecimaris]SMD32334.1 hypothetical protein SAMN04488029_0679 [Reichenbachiella faecimaris]
MNSEQIQRIEKTHYGKGLISQYNSSVNQIIIGIQYSGNDEYFAAPRKLNITPTDRVVQYIDCINDSCTKGIIDFTFTLQLMLAKSQMEYLEDIICDGYQDEERMRGNGSRCRARTQIKISIEYRK